MSCNCKCAHDILDHDRYTMHCMIRGCDCDCFAEDLRMCECGHGINFHQEACSRCDCGEFRLKE